MTTSTRALRRFPNPASTACRRRQDRPHGFTLVEVLIGATLSSFILAGVLSAFLFLGRSGANIANYNEMETQARRTLEQFAQDTRQASTITWLSPTAVRMNVDFSLVEYSYAAGTFVRREWVPLPSPGSWRSTVLLTGITDFAFKAYSISCDELKEIGTTTSLADASKKTKQLQISLQAARTSKTVTTATNTVLSARFILRNKKVTV